MSDDPDLRELSSLDAWGDRLRDAAEREERHSAGRRLPVKRFAVALAVMLLAVPGAVATRSIWVDPIDRLDPRRDPDTTPAVELATGRSGPVAWTVGGWRRTNSDTQCVQLQTRAEDARLGAVCSHVGGGAARILTATDEREGLGFVYGTVAPQVTAVRVTVPGGRFRRVATAQPDSDALRRARMPALRVYVAAFKGGFDATRPPVVVGYDAAGEEVGRRPEAAG